MNSPVPLRLVFAFLQETTWGPAYESEESNVLGGKPIILATLTTTTKIRPYRRGLVPKA